jgi:hypothetical protein
MLVEHLLQDQNYWAAENILELCFDPAITNPANTWSSVKGFLERDDLEQDEEDLVAKVSMLQVILRGCLQSSSFDSTLVAFQAWEQKIAMHTRLRRRLEDLYGDECWQESRQNLRYLLIKFDKEVYDCIIRRRFQPRSEYSRELMALNKQATCKHDLHLQQEVAWRLEVIREGKEPISLVRPFGLTAVPLNIYRKMYEDDFLNHRLALVTEQKSLPADKDARSASQTLFALRAEDQRQSPSPWQLSQRYTNLQEDDYPEHRAALRETNSPLTNNPKKATSQIPLVSRTEDRPLPPWQYSQNLGGYYIYQPSHDLIILQTGQQFPRPTQIPVASLSNAIWEYTRSPQRSADAYHLQGPQGRQVQPQIGRPQALQQPAPRYQYPRSPLEQQQYAPRAMSTQGLAQAMAQTHTAPQSSQAPVQTNRFQYNGKEMMQAMDPRTQVRVLVETSPPEQITGPEMLAQGITARQSLLGTQSGDTEKLDPSFYIRPAKFFVFGRVFKILWAEPAGGNTAVTQNTVENKFGERVHSKVRWFVVIRQTPGAKYCSALSITTYGGKGVGKPGVVKSEHGVIYTGKDAPRLDQTELPRRNEEGIRSVPIRVDPDSALDRLDAKSRINFAAVHTVHHNIKVKSLGIVNAASLTVLQQHFQNVWSPLRAGPARAQPRQTQQQSATTTKAAAGGEASVNLFGKQAAKVNVGGFATTREVKHGKAAVVEEDEDEEMGDDDDDDAGSGAASADEDDGDDGENGDDDADENDEGEDEEDEESEDE